MLVSSCVDHVGEEELAQKYSFGRLKAVALGLACQGRDKQRCHLSIPDSLCDGGRSAT